MWRQMRAAAEDLGTKFFETVFNELGAEYEVAAGRDLSLTTVAQGFRLVAWGLDPRDGFSQVFEPVRRRGWLSRNWEPIQNVEEATLAIENRILTWIGEARA
ncbi:MAG: hypothetical protein ACRDKS_04435 [Actinomycetota bacterium]